MKATERRQALLEYLCEVRRTTITNIQEEFNVSRSTAKRDVFELSLSYYDGSHYIGIKPSRGPQGAKRRRKEEVISVEENVCLEPKEKGIKKEELQDKKEEETDSPIGVSQKERVRQITKKEYFNELYEKYEGLPRKEKKEKIVRKMKPYFKTEKQCREFVEENFQRKKRNEIVRKERAKRKSYLQEFNYFCTFTYDGKKITEKEFKKKLKYCFWNLAKRNGWEYMGVWERGAKNKRLHFHGLFYIPKTEMVGEIEERNDYNFSEKKRVTTFQNTYFAKKFGRNDFKEIVTPTDINDSVSYLLKYIEKSGERIVCSKGVKQYFISDVLDSDVICDYGMWDCKMILSDSFNCIKDGEIMGTVSKETIRMMDKTD